MVAAAKDLEFTENEQNIVDCAFKAVGIFDGICAEIAAPAPPVVDAGASDEETTSSDAGTKTHTSKKKSVAPVESTGGCSTAGGTAGGGSALGLGLVLALATRRRKSIRRRPPIDPHSTGLGGARRR